ncbi:MAG TPA: energy-coupling factor ABC transporter permease, partial [Micromonosporaceae bacterium]|nr:energy-coupling factor ABC transporter permease [Micromonosporaceae bacterium]
LLLRVLPRTTAGLGITAFVASVVSVAVAAQAFVLEFWLGGQVALRMSLAGVSGLMAGTHLLIGVGEGLVTAATVLAVAKVRPDLVYALRGLRRRERRAAPARPSPVESPAVESTA